MYFQALKKKKLIKVKAISIFIFIRVFHEFVWCVHKHSDKSNEVVTIRFLFLIISRGDHSYL